MIEHDKNQADDAASLASNEIRQCSERLRASLADDLLSSVGTRHRAPGGGSSFYAYEPKHPMSSTVIEDIALKTQTLALRPASEEQSKRLMVHFSELESLKHQCLQLEDYEKTLDNEKSTFCNSLARTLQEISSEDDAPVTARVRLKLSELLGAQNKALNSADSYQSLHEVSKLASLLDDALIEFEQEAAFQSFIELSDSLNELGSRFASFEQQYTRVSHEYERLVEMLYEEAIQAGGSARTAKD